jgi:hypothetical protein
VKPLRLAAVVAFLALVVSPAYGTSCVPLVEWNDVTYDGGMNLARAPMLYAAPGYLAILPGEPFTTSSLVLAAAPRFGARRGAPNQRRGFRCDETFRLDGTVEVTPVWATNFRARVTRASGSARGRVGQTLILFVDSRTEIVGLRRNGNSLPRGGRAGERRRRALSWER